MVTLAWRGRLQPGTLLRLIANHAYLLVTLREELVKHLSRTTNIRPRGIKTILEISNPVLVCSRVSRATIQLERNPISLDILAFMQEYPEPKTFIALPVLQVSMNEVH